MHHSGRWTIREGLGDNLRIALYVRDTLGLVDGSAFAIPPLVPNVPTSNQAEQREATTQAWNVWFHQLLTVEPPVASDEPRTLLLNAAPTPTLRPMVEELIETASLWVEQRRADHIKNFQRQSHEQRVALSRFVDEFERSLGRGAAPFALHITTLPVAGHWAHRARRDHVLLSEETRCNPQELEAVLTPVLREVA